MSAIIDGTLGITTPNTITSAGATALTLQSGGTTAMTIDTSQNVGIGTTVNNVYDQVASARPLVVQKSDTNTTLNGSLANITIVNSDTTTNNTAQLNFAAITGASTNQYSSASISTIFGARTNTVYPSGILTFSTSAATQAPVEQMRIDSAGLLKFNSGYGSAATAYGCRAWVNFNGTGTVAIRASGNVSSITDNGTGDYTVNFTTALVDANYSTTGAAGVSGTGTGLMGSWFTANRDQTTGSTVNPTTSAVRVGALTSSPTPSAVDVPHMLVAIFR